MNCKKCGSPLIEGASICSVCGEVVGQVQQSIMDSEPIETLDPLTPPTPVAPVEAISPVVPTQAQMPVEPITPVMPTQAPLPVEPIQPVTQVQSAPSVPPMGTINTSSLPPEPPQKKNNNILYIVLCVIFVVIIIVLLVLILTKDKDSDDKENTKETTNKTTETTTTTVESTTLGTTTTSTSTTTERVTSTTSQSTTTSTKISSTNENYITFGGYQLYIPNTFTADASSDFITFTSTSKKQKFTVQVYNTSYSQFEKVMDLAAEEYKNSGMNVTYTGVKEHSGKKFAIIEGEKSVSKVALGFTELAPNYSLGFTLLLDVATVDAYFETLSQIISNSKKL